MTFRYWIRKLFDRSVTGKTRKAAHGVRPSVEPLEERWVPASFVVNNPTDSNVGGELDLRQAIVSADSSPGANTITFDPTVFATNQTITLVGGQSLSLGGVGETETITGPAAGVTVDMGGADSRLVIVGPGAAVSISGLTFSGARGGAIDNLGTLTLSNCTITGNSGANLTAGITNQGTLIVSDSTITGNSDSTYTDNTVNDARGGGIYNGSQGTLVVSDSTISDNTASSGGGIYNLGSLTLSNSTVTDNFAAYDNGGGVCNSGAGTLTIDNTIVAQNNANESGPNAYGTFASQGSNLIGVTDGSSGWVGSDLTGTGALPLNPMLAPLDFYGGPTETVALLPGSPAIGAGSAGGITTDQRGFPLDSPIDIGAFQFDSVPLIVNTTADGSGCPPGQLDLRGAVDLANVQTSARSITFDPTVFASAQTITLIARSLSVANTSGTETITGPAAGVAVSGGGRSDILVVAGYANASISGLTIEDGVGDSDGGIENNGTLTLSNCVLTGNSGYSAGGIENAGTLTISNSLLTGNTSAERGGGIYNVFGNLTVNDSTISGNSAGGDGYGGGIYNYSLGSITLSDSTVSDNSARHTGGGIYNAGSMTLSDSTISGNSSVYGAGVGNQGSVTLSNSNVADNSAEYQGAGITNYSGSTVTLNHSTISDNTDGSAGGGILNFGTLTVGNSTVSGNSAGIEGGGIFNADSVTLSDSTISGNSVGGDGYGGGIYNNGGTLAMSLSTISENTGGDGGGMYNYGGTLTVSLSTISGNTGLYGAGVLNYGSVTLSNSTVADNSAENQGGGIANYVYLAAVGTATVSNSTISGNTAGSAGGGIFNIGTLTVGNTIVAGNSAAGGPDAYGTVASQGNNLIGETDDSSGWVASDLTGTVALPLDPLLAPLGNYGGPTETIALLAGSPAIGAGNVSLAVDANGNPLATDQRGAPRTVNGMVDIGAFERQTAVTSISPNSGPSTGGTTVIITGFGFTGASAVNFGANSATFTVDSTTQITANDPAGGGVVGVTVTTPIGTSAASSADHFTYLPTPTISVSATNITYGEPVLDAGITATATGLGGATASSAFPGALVPAYFYPSPGGSPWNQLTAAAAAGTPIMAIMNPDSGPGSAVDPNYVSAVNGLRAAGGNVIGYVATGYATVPLATVEAEIDDYRSWYDVNGIFVDEMTNDSSAADLQYYQAIDDYVHALQPGSIVVGNPGTSTPEAYTQVADVLVEFENDGSDYGSSYTPPSWETNYPASRIANIVYNVASESTMESYVAQAESEHVGWLYVTDDTLPNPYGALPSYWSDFLAAEASSGDTAGSGGQTISGSFAFTYTDSQGNTLSTAPTAVGTYTVTATFTSTDPDYASGASGSAVFSIAPTVTGSTAGMLVDAPTLTIDGTGFDPIAGDNTVSFNNGAVGTVTSATATSLTVTFSTQPNAAGSLTAVVTTDSVSSGSPVQVATVSFVTSVAVNGDYAPIVDISSNGSGTVTVTTDGNNGFTAGNTVVISGYTGANAGYDGTFTVQSASGNQFTVTNSTPGLPTLSGNSTGIAISQNTASALRGNQRSMVDSVAYTFTSPVSLTASNFTLTTSAPSVSGAPTSAPAPATLYPGMTLTSLAGGSIWVVTWVSGGGTGASVTGHSLADGVYNITLGNSNEGADTFYRLFGNVIGYNSTSHTASLNNQDSLTFTHAYLLSTGAALYLADADFDANGVINNTDSLNFTHRYLSVWSGFLPTI